MLKEMYWETGIDFAVVSVACCREWSKLMGSKRDVSRLCERCRCDGSDQRDESGGRIGSRQSARADESHAKSAVAGSSGGQRDEFGGALALHFNGELGDGNGAPRSVGSYRDESDARTATIVSSGEEGWMVCALIDWCDWLNGWRNDRLRLSKEAGGIATQMVSVKGTPVSEACAAAPVCRRNSKYRTLDGSCNNLRRPLLGRANTGLGRLLPARYEDGKTLLCGLCGKRLTQLPMTRW